MGYPPQFIERPRRGPTFTAQGNALGNRCNEIGTLKGCYENDSCDDSWARTQLEAAVFHPFRVARIAALDPGRCPGLGMSCPYGAAKCMRPDL